MSKEKLEPLAKARRIVELQRQILKARTKIHELHFVNTQAYNMRCAIEQNLNVLMGEYSSLSRLPEPEPLIQNRETKDFPNIVFDPRIGIVAARNERMRKAFQGSR